MQSPAASTTTSALLSSVHHLTTSALLSSVHHPTNAAAAAATLRRLQAAASCAAPSAAPALPALAAAAPGVISLALLFAWRRAPPSLRSRALGFLKLAHLAQQQGGQQHSEAGAGSLDVAQHAQQQGEQQHSEAGAGSLNVIQLVQQQGGRQQAAAGVGSHSSHGGPEGRFQPLQKMGCHATAGDREGGSGCVQQEPQAGSSSRTWRGEAGPQQLQHRADRDPVASSAPPASTSRRATQVGSSSGVPPGMLGKAYAGFPCLLMVSNLLLCGYCNKTLGRVEVLHQQHSPHLQEVTAAAAAQPAGSPAVSGHRTSSQGVQVEAIEVDELVLTQLREAQSDLQFMVGSSVCWIMPGPGRSQTSQEGWLQSSLLSHAVSCSGLMAWTHTASCCACS